MSFRRIQTCHPARKEFMLDTHAQQVYIAKLLVRLGYKYIIGWKDVRGYGVYGIQFPEYANGLTPEKVHPYVDL